MRGTMFTCTVAMVAAMAVAPVLTGCSTPFGGETHGADAVANATAKYGTSITPGLIGGLALGTTLLTLPATKKLPTDHVLTWATGKDCSIIHFEKEGEYCKSYPQEVDRSKLVCTKTLGGVDCHERPDRHAGNERILASPAPPPRED
ncbi:MAG: hypothetical protein WCK65_10110 [Rhodospirillaceae bacterium]